MLDKHLVLFSRYRFGPQFNHICNCLVIWQICDGIFMNVWNKFSGEKMINQQWTAISRHFFYFMITNIRHQIWGLQAENLFWMSNSTNTRKCKYHSFSQRFFGDKCVRLKFLSSFLIFPDVRPGTMGILICVYANFW